MKVRIGQVKIDLTLLPLQGNETAKRLAQDDKEGKVPKAMYNHYTIITADADGQYTQTAYAEYFKDEINLILTIFDRWIGGKACCILHFNSQAQSLRSLNMIAKSKCYYCQGLATHFHVC